jgi:uncharacterized membrane protein YgcG
MHNGLFYYGVDLKVFLFSIFISLSLFSKTPIPLEHTEYPQIDAAYIDQINLLGPEDQEKIQAQVKSIQRLLGIRLQVIIFKNVNDLSIDELTSITYEKLQLSKKEKNNTILLLISMHLREIKIEVGKDLKSILTQEMAQKLINEKIVPQFKEQNYYDGLNSALIYLKSLQVNKEEAIPSLKDINLKDHYFVKVRKEIKNKKFILPLVIFIATFWILLKLIRGAQILKPIVGAIYFGALTYFIYPSLEFILLSIMIGFSIGLLSPLNSIIYFLSNSSRGHQHKTSRSQLGLSWYDKNGKSSVHGIHGRIK